MRYFGLFTFGFGFLMSALFIAWGILLIAAPEKVLPIYKFFSWSKDFTREREKFLKVSRRSNAILGICSIGFAIIVLQSLIRSLIHIYSR